MKKLNRETPSSPDSVWDIWIAILAGILFTASSK